MLRATEAIYAKVQYNALRDNASPVFAFPYCPV